MDKDLIEQVLRESLRVHVDIKKHDGKIKVRVALSLDDSPNEEIDFDLDWVDLND